MYYVPGAGSPPCHRHCHNPSTSSPPFGMIGAALGVFCFLFTFCGSDALLTSTGNV